MYKKLLSETMKLQELEDTGSTWREDIDKLHATTEPTFSFLKPGDKISYLKGNKRVSATINKKDEGGLLHLDNGDIIDPAPAEGYGVKRQSK